MYLLTNLYTSQSDASYLLSRLEQGLSNEAVLNEFKKRVGANRFHRICARLGIRDHQAFVIIKEIAKKILIGMAEIQKADLDELSGSIGSRFKKLTPFNNLEELETFFGENGTKIQQFKIDKAKTSGKGFQGLSERVYICLRHHFSLFNRASTKEREIRDAEMLTSRLADREIQKGNVFHLKEGYFYVDEVFIGGGAYVSILKDCEGRQPPKIVCRGTALSLNATGNWKTGLNNVLLEIGTMGVKSIWPRLSKYLQENQIQSVEVLGKSLGGAHAQELAVLIEAINRVHIEKLTTCFSVGVSEEINELFKSEVLGKRKRPFVMQVIRNGGEDSQKEIDYIPLVGGVHLGEGADPNQCNTEIFYIRPGEQEVGVLRENFSFFHQVVNFLHSFSFAHCRQSTLENFKWKKIDHDDIQSHLRLSKQLEGIRKVVAYIIHFATLFLLNGRSFQSYFSRQKEMKQSMKPAVALEF